MAPFAPSIKARPRAHRRADGHPGAVQPGADRAGPGADRGGARPGRAAAAVRRAARLRGRAEHDLRDVELVHDAGGQPPAARRGRSRVRGRHPDGLGVVPGEGPRHRRGRLRRVGQLRVGGGRSGPAHRRLDGSRGCRRLAVGDRRGRCDRRGLRRRLLVRRRRLPAARCGRGPEAPDGCAGRPDPRCGVGARGSAGAGGRRARRGGVAHRSRRRAVPRRPADRAGRGRGVPAVAG